MRNHQELVQLLIREGSFFWAGDDAGRTPVFLAAAMGNLESLKILLVAGAPPVCSTNFGESIMNKAKDPNILYLLRKALQYHVGAKMAVKPKYFFHEWRRS